MQEIAVPNQHVQVTKKFVFFASIADGCNPFTDGLGLVIQGAGLSIYLSTWKWAFEPSTLLQDLDIIDWY